MRFIDVHHHILNGIDDGPVTLKDMENMIDLADNDGISVIVATPHAFPGVRPFDLWQFRETLGYALDYCQRQRYAMRIMEGAEILYTSSAINEICSQRIPTLNGTDFVLVEWPHNSSIDVVANGLRCLNNEGLIPVVAHVERLRCFWRKPAQLIELRSKMDIRLQLNASTVLRQDMLGNRYLVQRLLKEGVIDYIASDAHNMSDRRTRMSEAYSRIEKEYGTLSAQRMMWENQHEFIC